MFSAQHKECLHVIRDALRNHIISSGGSLTFLEKLRFRFGIHPKSQQPPAARAQKLNGLCYLN